MKTLLLGLSFLATVAAYPAPSWSAFATKPDDWFHRPEGRRVLDNVLSWQSPLGSWPKNKDTTATPYTGDPRKLNGTFDNGATTGELRFLARAFRATQEARLREAFSKGLDHILKAQYPTGGWPQSYPPGTKYHRHITFNDDAMVRLMNFVRDVAKSDEFAFVEARQRVAARESFNRGIQCILKCQIAVNGKLTAWCAQHDELTLEPRPARSYELVSLSGAESAGLLGLLMSLENPGPDVVRAIEAGVAWYESARLTGLRQTKEGGDKVILKEPAAPPLWARFYEIETNRPMFSSRDGVKKYDLMEVERERRNGYAWYGNWGERVVRDYARWRPQANR